MWLPCSLWNLLDHLLPPGQKQLCACHILPSPRHVTQTLCPNRVSPEQQLGISPHFPSPHLTTSLQFPCPPQIPRIFPLQSPSFRAEPPSQDPPVQHILCCCTSREQWEGKCNIKAIPSHIFLAPWEEAACLPAGFFALFHLFFSHGTVKKCHGTAERARAIMRNEWFSQEFLGAEPGRSQTWQHHP